MTGAAPFGETCVSGYGWLLCARKCLRRQVRDERSQNQGEQFHHICVLMVLLRNKRWRIHFHTDLRVSYHPDIRTTVTRRAETWPRQGSGRV